MIAVGRRRQLQGMAVERLLDPSPAALKRLESCFERALFACRWDEARRWLHWLSEVFRRLPEAQRTPDIAELFETIDGLETSNVTPADWDEIRREDQVAEVNP